MNLDLNDLVSFLKNDNPDDVKKLSRQAYEVKLNAVGPIVYFRGIVEFSNICYKDCYYCGIRKSNPYFQRYRMPREEIINSALWAYEQNYGSIVLQSGERGDEEFVLFVDSILREIKEKTDGKLGITLSLGEQSRDIYRRWFELGASRYLLRIETSNPELYRKLHPEDHSYSRRRECLDTLRELGYQVGTGVMIGLPFQTEENMAADILFFREMDIDMIGMGPYIVHKHTPLYKDSDPSREAAEKRLELALKMIALTRLALKDVNIAATTALQAIHPLGREQALRAGANIIMPNITPGKYREDYLLYEDKPCTDEETEDCLDCLAKRIQLAGETVGYGKWGDSPHYFRRMNKI